MDAETRYLLDECRLHRAQALAVMTYPPAKGFEEEARAAFEVWSQLASFFEGGGRTDQDAVLNFVSDQTYLILETEQDAEHELHLLEAFGEALTLIETKRRLYRMERHGAAHGV